MAAVTQAFLAIDQGGHASRALAFGSTGQRLGEGYAAVATQRTPDGRVEHDAEELIASLRAAIGEACRRVAAGGLSIAAAGLATQRSSMVCWHRRTGEALSPVISWQDRRHADWLRQFEPSRDWIRAHTGLVLTAHYGASKMRWCLDHLPAVQAAAAAGELAMGPLASFILSRLLDSQPFVADPANASRTQLWDPATRDWSAPLLELFGVPRAALPRCVTSRHDYGALATSAGALPLVVATGDQSAVPFAVGALDPAAAYLNVGTGAFVQRAIRDRLPDAPRLLASVVWSDASGVDYMLEGTVNGAGSALDWFAARERVDLPALLASLETSAGALDPPLFLNGVSGIGSPFWMSELEPRFVGSGGVAAQALAVLESIVFLIRVNLDELGPHGPPLRRIVLTGGLASSNLFCQRLADVAGIEVWRSREPEATARGLAWLVAGSPPGWPSPEGDAFLPRADAALLARFVAWQSVMPALAVRR
jgi:glycerol kinase